MNELLLVLFMILLSAFFSGTEIAYFSANRLKIELRNKQGELNARILSGFMHKPGTFITTLLIGNNLALVLYGLGFSRLLDPWMQEIAPTTASGFSLISILLQTIISTLIILLFGEFIPKAVFRRDPDRMIQLISFPMLLFSWILFPVSWIVSRISYALMKYVFRVSTVGEKLVFGRTDLDRFMKETLHSEDGSAKEGNPDIDTEAFNKALDFNKTRVRDIMVPRIDIEAIPSDIGVSEVRNRFLETGLSRLVVYEDTLDHIKGTVHSIELFKRPASIEEMIQPVLIVPETMPAHLLLREFTQKRKSTAIVVDEFGGTSGLVTVEDLVEEILGDIEDEHDAPEEEDLLEKQEGPNEWVFSARQPVDYLNETYAFDLPEGDYTTLGGFVLHIAETIPAAGDHIPFKDLTFTIVEAEHNRIETLRVVRQESS
jgi:putative hemolysin